MKHSVTGKPGESLNPGARTRLASPQIFRGIAATWVVVFHANSLSESLCGRHTDSGIVRSGHIGVDFFFVLSGFIIYLIHERDVGVASSTRRYFLKRFARIFPLVFIVNTIKLAYMMMFSGLGVPSQKLNVNTILGSYLLLPDTNPWIHDVMWTLSYEMWFYVAFGLLLILGRRPMTVLGAAYALGIVGLHLPWCPKLVGLPAFVFSPFVLEFMVGVAVAALFMRRIDLRPGLAASLVLVAVALVAAGCALRWDELHGLARATFWGSSFALLLFAALQLEKRFSLARFKPLLFAGDASYSIYLFHSMPLNLGILVFRNSLAGSSALGAAIWLTILAVSAVASSMLFYVVVEAPIQRFFQARLSPPASKEPADTGRRHASH